MIDTLARIHRIVALAAAGGAMGEDGAWLASALEQWLAGDPWDAVCGLPPGWRREIARARRDEAIRELGDVVCPDGSHADKADAVRREIRRYETVWHRRDQYRTEPAGSDRVARLLFEIFAAGAVIKGDSVTVELTPDSPSQLRRILLNDCSR